jgi:transcription-repair coupling factor (superfamily II helicase)
MDLYRRLARLESESDAADLANEIADRFGPLPNPVRDIIDFCAIRGQCASSHVAKIEAGPSGIAVTFADEQARTLAEETPLERLGAVKWAGDRLILQIVTETPHERIEAVGKLLGALQAA